MRSGPPPALPEWRVEEYSALPSTQELIRQRLAAGEDVDGLVVRAAEQPAGRGQRAKPWASGPGGSYQSFALKDRWEGALSRPAITLLLAVHLAEALREAGARVSVKWPNDLYLGSGKVGGILSELLRSHLVVGVGVNVDNEVPAGAGALVGWELAYVNTLVLDAASACLSAAVLAGDTTAAELPTRLAPLDFLSGRTVVVRTARGDVSGRAAGVAADGALVVTTQEGKVALHSGTVLSWESVAE